MRQPRKTLPLPAPSQCKRVCRLTTPCGPLLSKGGIKLATPKYSLTHQVNLALHAPSTTQNRVLTRDLNSLSPRGCILFRGLTHPCHESILRRTVLLDPSSISPLCAALIRTVEDMGARSRRSLLGLAHAYGAFAPASAQDPIPARLPSCQRGRVADENGAPAAMLAEFESSE